MFEYLQKLSSEYNVSLENVLSIALNRYGLIIEDYEDARIRFNLKLLGTNKDTFFAVCVNTYAKSPFTLKDGLLYLEGTPIGSVNDIEKDTCTSTYFRNDKKVITFNSNSRSQCVGCKFCGTYSLTDDDQIDFSTKAKIQSYFRNLLSENDISGMEKIENVTICTGCFSSEQALFNHLMLVNDSFKEMGFNGSLNYIGSQLRDYGKIKELKESVGDFGIYLTIEKFLDREKFMRPEKASLTLDKAAALLEYCSSIGVTNTFLYILGLEDLETIKKYFNYFKDKINKFPISQVFQNYTASQEQYRCAEAGDIRYYLEAQKIINQIFSSSSLRPKIWECFRSLYFEEEKGKELIKCPEKKK